ncbi:hypothetical protein C6501_08095 [Candidatus Poribacteria bacterium]|nr:MAG: hypothetical protein C6501_08095 [Candidatus Poribacteria bacterium]
MDCLYLFREEALFELAGISADHRDIACSKTLNLFPNSRFKEGNFTLRGGIDLAYRENDRFVIVDWKIGKSGSNDNSLQMLAYAWWAKQEFKRLVNCIIPHRVHLADDTVSTFNVNEKYLGRVEARILQDLDRMREADGYGVRGIAEAFTPCAQPKICELCQFQEICPKE